MYILTNPWEHSTGRGLRLVVFLQGCNFRCLYCANPDTIEAGAGTLTDPAEILRMAVDQKPFFGRRGGVTFSGGEPTFQAAELVPLVKSLKEAGIHVCIDSNGGVWNPAVEELLGLVDPGAAGREAGRFRTPPRPHRTRKRADAPHGRLARSPRKTLLATLRAGSGHQRRRSRHPCAGERLGGYKSVERVELLPYHTLGVHKYEAMGLEYKLRDVRENTPEQLDRAAALLREYFPTVVVN